MLGVAGAMLLIFQAGNASSGTNHMRGNNISGSQHYGLLRLSDHHAFRRTKIYGSYPNEMDVPFHGHCSYSTGATEHQ